MFEEIKSLKSRLRIRQDECNMKLGKRNMLLAELTKKKELISTCEVDIDVYTKVVALLQNVSEHVRLGIVSKLENIVTEALQEIYPDKLLKFIISFDSSKSGVSVKFKVYDDINKQELNVLYAFGGGIKDIISTVLRVVVLELDGSSKNSSIILDETGKGISSEYQERFGKFLRVLSDRLNRQIILITHQQETIIPYANQVFKISQREGKSYIETDSISIV